MYRNIILTTGEEAGDGTLVADIVTGRLGVAEIPLDNYRGRYFMGTYYNERE